MAINDPTGTTPTGDPRGGNIPAVHTLKSDAAGLLNRQNVTVVDIARSDHQVREQDAQVMNIPARPNWAKRILIIITVILVLSIIGIGGYVSYKWYTKVPEPMRPSAFAPIIEANASTEYELPLNDTEALSEHIADARNMRLPAGQIRYMPIMLKRTGETFPFPADVKAFIQLATLEPPQILLDTLSGRWSMYTVYGENTADTAWLFGTNSNAPERVRAGMSEWERSIRKDFARFTSIPETSGPSSDTKTVPGITITRWIVRGTTGEDVLTLQTFLKDIGNLPAEYVPSKTMDNVAVEALKKYQCDQKLVCAGTADDGYGATGPKTRTALLAGLAIKDTTAGTNIVGEFTPDTIENVEVRVLRDGTSSSGLYAYALFNNNLLVLTTSPEALRVMLQLVRVKRIDL